jgi:hypothetical protein
MVMKQRLPNPEAHKKFIVSFCNKGKIEVMFIAGLKVPFASFRGGRAVVGLREPMITDLTDNKWDADAYHEASHLLPELAFTYEALTLYVKTGLEKTIMNVIVDNMCERVRHGKYKGRDKSLYLGRYDYTIENRDVVMNRKHPSISALYVVDFRDRNSWQGFFPDLKPMEGGDWYLPRIEALDVSQRIPMIMESQSAEELYELVTDITELAKQQPPPPQQQEEEQDDDDSDNNPDTDGDTDESDTDGDSGEPDGDDTEPDDDSDQEDTDSEGEDVSGEDSEGGEEDDVPGDTDTQSDGEGQGDDEDEEGMPGSDSSEEADGSEGSNDNDGHGDDQDSGDSGPGDSDSLEDGDDPGGNESGESSDQSDHDDNADGSEPACGDGTGSVASWDPINEDDVDLADPNKQMTPNDEQPLAEKEYAQYTPMGNYRLVKLHNTGINSYMKDEILSHVDASTLTRSVQKYLKCMTKDTYQYGMERGKLHAKHLPRIFTAERKPRIFKQKHEHILRTDTAVGMLVDCSSSMGTERFAVAMAASLVVSDTLRDLSIVHEILGFTEDRKIISIYEVKAYHEHISREHIIDRMSSNRIEKDYTPDAESIVYAGSRLLERPEANKLLIVMCDGQPMGNFTGSGSWYLRQVCKMIDEGNDMNLIGVGIMMEKVREYYKNAAVVHNIKRDLEPVMIEALKHTLL